MRKMISIYLVAVLCLLSVSVMADYMDGFVDMEDYAVLAAAWQNPADINDLTLLAECWLTYYTAPPSLAWWEMEETSGNYAYDSTENAYDLVPTDGFVIAGATTEGQIGNGFLFDGTGERLTEPTLLDDFPDAITIAGWVKPDATGMSKTQTWFSKINADALGYAINLTFKMSGSTPNVIAANGRSEGDWPGAYLGEYFNCNSSVTWVDDTWYHVAFTWDATGCEIYVDGQSEGNDDMPIMGDLIPDRNAIDLTIGNGGDTVVSLSEPFKGTVDDVRLYSSVLSLADIQNLYNSAAGLETYPLIVNNGTGSGSYVEDEIVDIVADILPTGQAFEVWIGNVATVADIYDPTTTITMPAAVTTVTATYEDVPLYTLTVNSGTGDGSYVESLVVDITADTAPIGQMFDDWTGDTATVTDIYNPNTTVTMPAQNVTLTATYKSPHTLTVNNGTGGGDYYKNTVVDIAFDPPPVNQMFDVWTGDTTYVADIYDQTTTFTMPDMAASVTATYKAIPPHDPPVVDAGDDQMLDPPMNSVAILKGIATDDGIPNLGLNYFWEKISGPGSVTFSDDTAADTEATITVAGTYVLQLSVDDGYLTGTDTLTIKVHDNGRLTYPITYTDIPKAMSDMSNYTEIYTVDLNAFGIYNDGTHPVETAAGINNMLQATKTMNPKPNRIVFPAGTYLISEFDPIIFDLKDTIVDLNGATLKLNPSAELVTDLTIIDRGTENFRLTNGVLMGDRYDHDYSGGYSGGRAVKVLSGYNMEIDHLTIRDFTGYTFYSSNGIANATETGQYTYVYNTNLESGAFNSFGTKIASSSKIRTISSYDLTKYNEDELEFGYTWGYMGLYEITEREYQAYFYDASNNFIEKQNCIQYKKVSFPSDAKYIHLEFNQSNIPTGSQVGRLTDMEPPEHVWMHDNWLYRNRGLGQAFCGGQKWIIENNHYEENGTVLDDGGFWAPAYGVDFEDGWDLMQDVVFRNNTFDGNFGDLVVCAGSEMIFEGNQFSSLVSFKSRCENRVFRNNTMYGNRFNQGSLGVVTQSNRTGHMSVHDNSYTHARLSFNNDDAYNPPLVMLENEYLYDITQFNTSPNDDGDDFVAIGCTMEQTEWSIEDFMTYIEFDNCTFVGSQVFLNFEEPGPSVTVTETNCTGTLNRTGPYTSREE